MPWMWTDDLARMLLDRDDRSGSEPGPYPAPLGRWLERPVAIRVTDDDLTAFEAPQSDGSD